MADSTLDPTREKPPGSDEHGTGERATAGRDDDAGESSDIAPDRIIGSELPLPTDTLDRVVTDDARGEVSEVEDHLPDGAPR